jgi:urease accessory protein
MNKVTLNRFVAVGTAALVFPTLAHAHSGHSLVYDCASGFAHPLHGWDHLLAMVAVGFWARQLGGHARWSVPAAFVGVMTCAAVLGSRGVAWPGTEPMIATSMLVLGLLIVTAGRVPVGVGVTLVSLFAAGHGFAHGAEMPLNSGALPYVTGFVLATLALHVLGLGLGHLALRQPNFLPRVMGAGCAAAGALLLLA